jgi:hypothetical protein
MKSLISFSLLSLFVFTGITNRSTTAQHPKTKPTIDKVDTLGMLSFNTTIKKPADSLVRQIRKLDKSVRHAESEILGIKESNLQKDSSKFYTFVKSDTLIKKDSVVFKKKGFLKKIIDKLK